MSNLKFVIVGGGSVAWTPHLATDYFLTPELSGSKLVLVDIDKPAAELMQRYLSKMRDKVGAKWDIEVADLDSALDKADGVCVSISTGGFEAMHNDYTIPEKYGVYHSVGDTVGPGGISRVLRNVPVFIDIARRMEKLCPDTWLVHVTNPLAQITRSVWKGSNMRALGLCHNFIGTRAFLAKFLNAEPNDIHATSVGVNHYTWLTNITCRGKDVSDKMTVENYHAYEAAKVAALEKTGTMDDAVAKDTGEINTHRYLLNMELYERFGIFPVGASSHVVENFPFYSHSEETLKKHCVHRKGVLPTRADGKAKRRQKIIDQVEGRADLPNPELSFEGVAPIMSALTTGKKYNAVVNIPNRGQIPNLPLDAVVESWGVVTWNAVEPVVAAPVPPSILGMIQLAISEEELAVEAALTGDRKTVIQAMHVSPMVKDKDRIPELVDELLAANKKWLPQF